MARMFFGALGLLAGLSVARAAASTAPEGGIKLLWQAKSPNTFWELTAPGHNGTAVVAGSRSYAPPNDLIRYACLSKYSATSGTRLWDYNTSVAGNLDFWGITSVMHAPRDAQFPDLVVWTGSRRPVGESDGEAVVVGLDGNTGKQLWIVHVPKSKPQAYNSAATLLSIHGTIVVVSVQDSADDSDTSYSTLIIDAQTGGQIHQVTRQHAADAVCLSKDRTRLYTASQDPGYLDAFEVQKGKGAPVALWSVPTAAAWFLAPSVVSEDVFACSSRGAARVTAAGSVVWNNTDPRAACIVLAVADAPANSAFSGLIFVATIANPEEGNPANWKSRLSSIEAATGKVLASIIVPHAPGVSPGMGGLVASADGSGGATLHALIDIVPSGSASGGAFFIGYKVGVDGQFTSLPSYAWDSTLRSSGVVLGDPKGPVVLNVSGATLAVVAGTETGVVVGLSMQA